MKNRGIEKDNTCYIANISDFMSLWTESSFDHMLCAKGISLLVNPKMLYDAQKSKLQESVQ